MSLRPALLVALALFTFAALALPSPAAAQIARPVADPAGGEEQVDAQPPSIAAILEPIRLRYGLPAMGAAIVTSDGLTAIGTTGVRRSGTDVPATPEDLWHLGSDTKAMTATMIAALVEQGTLTWDTTLAQAFPELVAEMHPLMQQVTFLHLLSHRAGLPPNLNWAQIARTGTLREQRLQAVRQAASAQPLTSPGTGYEYSNLGYVVAGAMAERTTGRTWEALIQELLFQPLGMTSAGFGGTGTLGQLDQPWQHRADGTPTASNGPAVDNPPVMGPAGTVHATLTDWAKYIADQLRGERGGRSLLGSEAYRALHTPPFGNDYALGWGVRERSWGGGRVFTHSGSNTMNHAVVWMAPARDFAVIVTTNRGGDDAARACDDAAAALIRAYVP